LNQVGLNETFFRDYFRRFFKEDFGKSSALIYLKKEVELFFDKNPLEVPFDGAYRVFYRWKVFSILGKYFPRVFLVKNVQNLSSFVL
jgi:hypothetical protein